MFQFTSFASSAYLYSADDVIVLTMTGSPIQISPDQRLFGNSPKLIAACHVFLRLLMPRHPPLALNSLATKLLTQSVTLLFNTLLIFSRTLLSLRMREYPFLTKTYIYIRIVKEQSLNQLKPPYRPHGNMNVSTDYLKKHT